ncbi:VOC family protein [Methylocystis heyeri]|uniref:Glyoxalase n=1 Tax=Methylocystis heyeri TaxID=391905 RepID=A0A6B8KDB9_9HYPH|nr:VOC family protein [Methylocystis heyeri]QGM44548.1 glyoxalase [Methylocystis heyeri]
MAPRLGDVLETALYVEDLDRAEEFYARVMGLDALSRDARLCALDCGPGSVLLLFLRGATRETVHLAGGEIPPHGGNGDLHFAFKIARQDLGAWESHLAACGVSVEARMSWPRGGVSLYFRDPDNNLLELATPGLWANY